MSVIFFIFIRKYPCLYQLDNDWNGFQWINANDGDRSHFQLYPQG